MLSWTKIKRLSAGVAALLLLPLLPDMASAQLTLQTDAGRVAFRQHEKMFTVMPLVRGVDWATEGRAGTFWYPSDEYAANNLNGFYPEGVIDEIIMPNNTLPDTWRFFRGQGGWNIGNTVPRSFNLTRRTRPPVLLVGRDAVPMTPPYSQLVDPTMPVDQMVQTEFPYEDGQTWTHTHFGNENPNLDRSIIIHWKQDYEGVTTEVGGDNQDSTILLPPGQVLTFWRGHHFSGTGARGHNLWNNNMSIWGHKEQDDFSDMMSAPSKYLSPADAPRAAQLDIVYLKDYRTDKHNNDFDGSLWDDTGDPLIGPEMAASDVNETGEFTNDKMLGTSYFHYDYDGASSMDRFSMTDLAEHAPGIYWVDRTRNVQWGGWSAYGEAKRFDFYTTPARYESEQLKHFRDSGADVSGAQWTGITEAAVAGMPVISQGSLNKGGVWSSLSAGPYALAPGDVHDVVFTFAMADLGRKLRQEYGTRYLKWIAQQKPGVHPNGDALPASVVPMSDYEKFLVLETVRDSLFKVVDMSFTAWHGGSGSGLSLDDKIAGMGLGKFPNGPPAPDIWAKGGPDRCEVYAWYPDDMMFLDVDTDVDDFAGWRVYRKEGRADVGQFDEIINFGFLDWILVGDISHSSAVDHAGNALSGVSPISTTDHYNADVAMADGTTRRGLQFLDNTASKGKNYFYAVTGYDDGSQNTTGFQPGQSQETDRTQAVTAKFGGGLAVTPFTPGMLQSDSVVVVPNPWARDLGAGRFSGTDQNKILFDKLPRLCKLKIYTETGDLITTINHTSQSAQEYWYQQTDQQMLVKSGIYILAVLEAKEVDPATNEVLGNLPDQFVKFVVIR